jgi:Family of unknown function (DUF5709)
LGRAFLEDTGRFEGWRCGGGEIVASTPSERTIVTDGSYEPMNDDAGDGEAIDLDQVLGDDEVDEALDTSYSPPERPRELDAFGTTVAEQRAGETLDQRLRQEEPDPAMQADLPDDQFEDGALDDGEVGDARAGRLVDPDEGLGEDTEKDVVGWDAGIDGGAASAEEAAMHIVEPQGSTPRRRTR